MKFSWHIISWFWSAHISRHLNSAILRKFFMAYEPYYTMLYKYGKGMRDFLGCFYFYFSLVCYILGAFLFHLRFLDMKWLQLTHIRRTLVEINVLWRLSQKLFHDSFMEWSSSVFTTGLTEQFSFFCIPHAFCWGLSIQQFLVVVNVFVVLFYTRPRVDTGTDSEMSLLNTLKDGRVTCIGFNNYEKFLSVSVHSFRMTLWLRLQYSQHN